MHNSKTQKLVFRIALPHATRGTAPFAFQRERPLFARARARARPGNRARPGPEPSVPGRAQESDRLCYRDGPSAALTAAGGCDPRRAGGAQTPPPPPARCSVSDSGAAVRGGLGFPGEAPFASRERCECLVPHREDTPLCTPGHCAFLGNDEAS